MHREPVKWWYGDSDRGADFDASEANQRALVRHCDRDRGADLDGKSSTEQMHIFDFFPFHNDD